MKFKPRTLSQLGGLICGNVDQDTGHFVYRMRYTLPTQHVLYFGIQAKKGKLDSSEATRAGNANIAEIHNKVLMMLSHEIFDPEIGKRVFVNHTFISPGARSRRQSETGSATHSTPPGAAGLRHGPG